MKSSEYIKWIMAQPQDGFSLRLVNDDHINVESSHADGEIQIYHLECDIVEMRLSSSSTHENFFFLHFELKDEDHAKGLFREMMDSLKKHENRKTLRVLLSCTSGLTTSFFASKLAEASATLSLDYQFEAVEYAKLYETGFDYNVILLAPQIGYQYKKAKEIFAGQTVISIPAAIFASYDAGAMISLIQSEVKKKRAEKEDIAIAEVMRDIDLNAGMFVINVTQDTNTSRYLQRLYEAGKVIHTEEVIKEKNALEDVLDILDTALRSLRKNFHVDAVSISVPGHLRVSDVVNKIDYDQLADQLSDHCGLPVYVHHNTAAVAYGYYAQQGKYDIVSYHSQPRGAYVGGQGCVYRGMPIDGMHQLGGELGPFFSDRWPDYTQTQDPPAPETVKQVLVSALIAHISMIAPEVILIRSELTPDMNEIREELKKYMDEENIPDLIHVRDIREYALLGTLLYGMRKYKSSVRKLVRSVQAENN